MKMGLTTLQQQQQQQPSQNQQQQSSVAASVSDITSHHGCTATLQQTCETSSLLPKECAGCGKRIVERYLLKAIDLLWHEDCVVCGCCNARLGEVGSSLFVKANLILCKRDYLRLFGNTGACSACNKIIPAYEMVMRAKYNVYHLECFACFACQHRFCVGDKYYLCDNKILCPYDYEERLVFAGLADNPTNLAHMKRQLNNLQPVTESRNNSMPTTSSLARFGPNEHEHATTNDSSISIHRIRPDRDDASSGYDSPDDSESFEKPHQLVQQQPS
ncbi:hypothetical protein ACKWTF_011840 [Chironomus riparius]